MRLQTKETLTTRPKDFGSSPELSDRFMKEVLASGIVDRVLSFARYKATAELQRVSGGKKSAKFVGLPKLDDANFAGTAKVRDFCFLLLRYLVVVCRHIILLRHLSDF